MKQSLRIAPVFALIAMCMLALPLAAQDQFVQTNGPYGGSLFDVGVAFDGTVVVVTTNFDVYRADGGGTAYVKLATVANDSTPQWIERAAVDSSGTFFIGGDYGVWHSDTRGATWQPSVSGIPRPSSTLNMQITDLEANARGAVIAVFTVPGIRSIAYRSTDKGRHWTEVPASAFGDEAPASVIVAPTGTLLVNTQRSIYRSDDNGMSWSRSSFTQ